MKRKTFRPTLARRPAKKPCLNIPGRAADTLDYVRIFNQINHLAPSWVRLGNRMIWL
jgi:hypothetical protein